MSKKRDEPAAFLQPKGEDVICSWPTSTLAAAQEAMSRAAKDAKELSSAGDDRSFAIMASILVEAAQDELLGAWMPSYKDEIRDEPRDFSFSARTKILRALAIVPYSILDAVDAIREMRNAFAHGLESKSFDELPKKKRDSLDGRFRSILGPHVAFRKTAPRRQFEMLVAVAVSALRDYRANAEQLRPILRDAARAIEAGQRHR